MLGAGLGQPGGTGCGRGLGVGWLPRDGARHGDGFPEIHSLKTGAFWLQSSCALQLPDCYMESGEKAPDWLGLYVLDRS